MMNAPIMAVTALLLATTPTKRHATTIAETITQATASPVVMPTAVIIGRQRWLDGNVAATQFRNGDALPEAQSASEWIAAGRAGRPARVAYANQAGNVARWGYLYNYAAIADPRGLCPAGYRVPDDADWRALEAALGGGVGAARSLKAMSGWATNGGATNMSGFGALPAGFRTQTGAFFLGERVAYFWSSTRSGAESTAHMLFEDARPLFRIQYDITMGMSLRCVATA